MKAACAKVKDEKKCNAQVGCTWRSESDVTDWVAATTKAVQSLNVSIHMHGSVFVKLDLAIRFVFFPTS